MKKSIYIFGLVVFSILFQASAYAYTKEDLELLRRNAAIAEALLSVPNLLSEKDQTELPRFELPAALLEKFVSCALETDCHVIAEITRILQTLKLCSKSRDGKDGAALMQYIVKLIALGVTHDIILKIYPKKRQRIVRRWMRVSTDAIIYALLEPEVRLRLLFPEDPSVAKNLNFVPKLILSLIAAGLKEWVGEKIIENAEDLEDEEEENQPKNEGALYI